MCWLPMNLHHAMSLWIGYPKRFQRGMIDYLRPMQLQFVKRILFTWPYLFLRYRAQELSAAPSLSSVALVVVAERSGDESRAFSACEDRLRARSLPPPLLPPPADVDDKPPYRLQIIPLSLLFLSPICSLSLSFSIAQLTLAFIHRSQHNILLF